MLTKMFYKKKHTELPEQLIGLVCSTLIPRMMYKIICTERLEQATGHRNEIFKSDKWEDKERRNQKLNN